MSLEKVLKNIISPALLSSLFILNSCSNKYQKLVSKLSNGEIEIQYGQFSSAKYLDRDQIIANRIDRPDNEDQTKSMIFSNSGVQQFDYKLS